MTRKRFPFLLMAVMALGVVSCSSAEAPMGKPIPSWTYDHLGAVKVSGGPVDIQRPLIRALQRAEGFVADPYQVISSYAQHRFYQNADVPMRMMFTIKDAYVTYHVPEKTVWEEMTFQEEEQYKLFIDIAMTPISAAGEASKPYGIQLNRTLRLSENLSLSQKEFRQFEFLEKAMSDIDQGVMDIVTNKIR